MAKHPNVLIFEVTLLHTEVWRIIEIQDRFTLHDLHKVIQLAFEWTNSHLYSFERKSGQNSVEYILPEYCEGLEIEVVNDPRDAKLKSLFFTNGDSIEYLYDFGDNWRHSITLKGKKREDPVFGLPACVAGAKKCPPEDIGGVGGYNDLLRAIDTKSKAELIEYRNWLGYDFDPDYFRIQDYWYLDKEMRKIKIE